MRTYERKQIFPIAAVVSLAVLYLLQVLAPLRIDNDSAVYLNVAVNLADTGVASGGQVPLGYPALVAGLITAGVGRAAGLMLLNHFFIAVGLLSFWWIARDISPSIRWTTIALTLLSFPVLRIAVMPHPDAVGFGLTLGVLALLNSVTRERSVRNVLLLTVALGGILATTTVRVAGVILVVPFVWVILGIATPPEATRKTKWRIALVAFLLVMGAIAVALGLSEAGTFARYQYEISRALTRAPIAHAVHRLAVMLRGVGELTINLPLFRFANVRPWLWIAGLPVAFLIARTIRTTKWSRPAGVFVVAWLVTLTIWPFHTVRLWVPIVPFLLLHVTTVAFSTEREYARTMLRAASIWFVIAGAAAIAYTSWVSLAGSDFRFRWGRNGGMAGIGHEDSDHNARAARLVRRLDGGDVAWRWLDSIPASMLKEGYPLRVREISESSDASEHAVLPR